MPDLSATATSLSRALLGRAADIGGELWQQIRQGARLYSRGYTQTLIDISRAVAAGDMTADEGKSAAASAGFFYYMAVAQATQATLAAIQALFDAVLAQLRQAINAVLPAPVL